MEKLIELRNVTKIYAHPSRPEATTVLDDLSLDVAAGDALAVIGPSGSGKSTLLNIMGALDRPTSGDVRFSGKILTELEDTELSVIRNQEIGFVFQLHYLLPYCTALENVLIPTLPYSRNRKRKDAHERAVRLLERVGLKEHMDHFPSQMSGGELQRTAVVRALINQPKLVLADEPTGSLDKHSSDKLAEILVQLNREEKTTLVVVTHSADLAGMLNSVYRLQDGALERTTLL